MHPMMSRRVRFTVAIAAIACVVGLTLLSVLNAAVRAVVLDPIVDGIDAVRYFLGYAPQQAEWVVAILLGFVVGAVYMTRRLPPRIEPERPSFGPRFSTEGSAMRLARMMEKATHDKFKRQEVILELRDLAARALAYRRGISPDEAKAALDTPTWTEDASVRSLLSLDKHRAGGQKNKSFQDQVDHALEVIERVFQEV